MKSISLVLLALVCCVSSVSAGEPPQRSEKAMKLLKERLDILTSNLDQLKRSQEKGLKGADELLTAQLAVYTAQLDLTPDRAERQKLYTKMLDELKRFEGQLKTAVGAGTATPSDLLQHRLREIDVEMSMEQDK